MHAAPQEAAAELKCKDQQLTWGPLVSYTSNTPEPPVSDTRRKGTYNHSEWIGMETLSHTKGCLLPTPRVEPGGAAL